MNKSNKRKPKKDGIKNIKINSNSIINSNYFYLILFVVFLIIDRLTKIWAMNLGEKIIDFKIFAFNYVINTGAGFSILQNMNVLLIWIMIAILGLIIIFYDKFPKVSLLLIISGLIGNLIDRIFLGHVVDFIDFKFWPIFNIADSLIVIGVSWMILLIIKEEFITSKKTKKEHKKNKNRKKK